MEAWVASLGVVPIDSNKSQIRLPAGVDRSLFFTVSIIEPVQEHMGNTLEGIAVAQLWLAFHPYKIVASLSSTIVFVAR